MKRTSLLFGSKFAAALLAALAAGTPLFAWTEEGDRLKREAKARAEAEAREATAAWYREYRVWNEAQRLAATESICRENITRFFAVEDDAFEKCRYFYPLATSVDWLRKYDLEKKYKTSSGFFTPYARLGEDKALQCGAKVDFSLDYRLFVTSVIFLFPDGETIEIFRSDFASSNARKHTSDGGPVRFDVVEKSPGTQYVEAWRSRTPGSRRTRYFVNRQKLRFEVSGELPGTRTWWKQGFDFPVSPELLEKIAASEKLDREFSPVELIGFRSVQKLKEIADAEFGAAAASVPADPAEN